MNSEELIVFCKNMLQELVPQWFIDTITIQEYNPMVFAAIGSVLVGLSGILPLLILPENLKYGAGSNTFKMILSFAVGGLLANVFLHLLPEAWENDVKNGTNGHPSLYSGLVVLLGLILFVSVEKIFSGLGQQDVETLTENKDKNTNNNTKDVYIPYEKNGFTKNGIKLVNKKSTTSNNKKHIAGYLNLLANSMDNFMHGLAVGGSFLISLRLGFLTVFAILIHEIPHEVGDFAILLRSGFTRWNAAFWQIITAAAGLVGSLVAVNCSASGNEMHEQVSWILPFTAGGFLHIALISILPELMEEENLIDSLKQLGSLLVGIVVMAVFTFID